MTRVVCAGDNVVDRYVGLGRMYPGGNAVNVAVGIRRSGVDAAYIGAVGNDDEGSCVLRALADEGVDTSRVRVLEGPSAFTDIYLVQGDRVFGESSEGVSRFELSEGDLALVAESELVHTGECGTLEVQLPQLSPLAPVSFDFSTRPNRYVQPLLPYVAFATFSRSDLSDSGCEALLREVCERGPAAALVTRGARGAMLFVNGRMHVHAGEAIEAVDSLGAGDAFIARVLAGHLSDESPDEVIASATEMAIAACRHYGGFGRGGTPWSHPLVVAPYRGAE